MSSEDNGIEVSQMREGVDTVQGDVAEGMSEVQVTYMVHPETSEEARYRVRLIDYQQIGKPILYLEYFADYLNAETRYEELCEDRAFIKHHKDDIMAEMQMAYRGWGELFWETIKSSVIYDDSE